MSKPSRPPGQGLPSARERGIAVGHVDDALEHVVDERPQRGAQLGEVAGQLPLQRRLRGLDRRDDAGAAKQPALAGGLDDDVGDEAGEADVVGADGQEHEIEAAAGLGALRAGDEVAQLRHLGGRSCAGRRCRCRN